MGGDLRRESLGRHPFLKPRLEGGTWTVASSSVGLEARMLEGGASLRSTGDAWRWDLRLSAFGREGALREVPPASPEPGKGRVEYRHAGTLEWHQALPEGIEQGYEIPARPGGEGELVLEQTVRTDLELLEATPGRVAYGRGGEVLLAYGKLVAYDALGRRLPSRMERDGDRVRLLVADAGAEYPLSVDPLSTTADTALESNQADAQFGFSVASAGDVNGDGFEDLIVGAPFFDNNNVDAGAARIYHGSAGGILSTEGWAMKESYFAEDGCEAGFSVASAGDVNGDGYDDVIVGAPYFDNAGDGFNEAGAFFISHGGASGVDTTVDLEWYGDQVDENLGWSVAGAGDVNGDGYADVIVGMPNYDIGLTDQGSMLVFHGSSSGLALAAQYDGDQSTCAFGQSVAGAGDVDGDGFSDVVVGAPLYDNGQSNEGRVYIFHGSSSGLTGPVANFEENLASAQQGYAVASAGDVDRDGFDDILTGSPYGFVTATEEGFILVYHGSSSGVSAGYDGAHYSGVASAHIGWSVSAGRDVDGDGYDDIPVGAPTTTWNKTQEGAAIVCHGGSGGVGIGSIFDWFVLGDQSTAYYGWSVGMGDFNGDGFADLAVGASQYNNAQTDEGRAYVYHSSDTTTFNTYLLPGKRLIQNPLASSEVDYAGPRVVRDSNGYWYFVWSAGRTTDILLSYTTTSAPTGTSAWSTITLVDNGGTGVVPGVAKTGSGSTPVVALSANDNLHFAWVSSNGGCYWSKCATLSSITTGTSWTTPVRVGTGTCPEEARDISIVVDSYGNAHVAFTSGTGGTYHAYYAKYDTSTSGFYSAVQLQRNQTKVRLAIDDEDNLYVAYTGVSALSNITLRATTNADTTLSSSPTWKNLAQTTTDHDIVTDTTNRTAPYDGFDLVVDYNGIVHVLWRARPVESAPGLKVRDGILGVGWTTTSTLSNTREWKRAFSLTAMGDGSAYAFSVARSGASRDAVYYTQYTPSTSYRSYGSWGTPTATSDLAPMRSQAVFSAKRPTRDKNGTLWFVADDQEHRMATSYLDRIGGANGWAPPAMTSSGWHPHYAYAFPRTAQALATQPLPVVAQTAMSAVYLVGGSASFPYLYAIDKGNGFVARSYVTTGNAQYVVAATYSSNTHLFLWTASNALTKLVDTGTAINLDTNWANNPLKRLNNVIGQPPLFLSEGGTRYLYFAQRNNIIAGDQDATQLKLYADNGKTVWTQNSTSNTLTCLSTFIEPATRVMNDHFLYPANAGGMVRREAADGTAPLRDSTSMGRVVHPVLVRDGNTIFLAPSDNWVWRLTGGLATSVWTSGQSANLSTMKTSGATASGSSVSKIWVGVGNQLYHLNAATGAIAANYPQPTSGNIVTLPVEWKTFVYFGSDTGKLFAVNKTSNIARANWPVTLDTTVATPVVRTIAIDALYGYVYFSTNEGRIYKFRLE